VGYSQQGANPENVAASAVLAVIPVSLLVPESVQDKRGSKRESPVSVPTPAKDTGLSEYDGENWCKAPNPGKCAERMY